jgi:hypothetical protein
MAPGLVGSIGTVSVGASGANVTPAYGANEDRTTGNLLICSVACTGSATIPSTPTGWTSAASKAGTNVSAIIFYKIATGADAAPTISGVTNAVLSVQLAEYSGASVGAKDRYGSASGTTSPLTATANGRDINKGELLIGVGAMRLAFGDGMAISATSNNASLTQVNNGGVGTAHHYDFARGITTSNAAADTYVQSFGGNAQTAVLVASFRANAETTAAGSTTTSGTVDEAHSNSAAGSVTTTLAGGRKRLRIRGHDFTAAIQEGSISIKTPIGELSTMEVILVGNQEAFFSEYGLGDRAMEGPEGAPLSPIDLEDSVIFEDMNRYFGGTVRSITPTSDLNQESTWWLKLSCQGYRNAVKDDVVTGQHIRSTVETLSERIAWLFLSFGYHQISVNGVIAAIPSFLDPVMPTEDFTGKDLGQGLDMMLGDANVVGHTEGMWGYAGWDVGHHRELILYTNNGEALGRTQEFADLVSPQQGYHYLGEEGISEYSNLSITVDSIDRIDMLYLQGSIASGLSNWYDRATVLNGPGLGPELATRVYRMAVIQDESITTQTDLDVAAVAFFASPSHNERTDVSVDIYEYRPHTGDILILPEGSRYTPYTQWNGAIQSTTISWPTWNQILVQLTAGSKLVTLDSQIETTPGN